jgi:hypothetical protein
MGRSKLIIDAQFVNLMQQIDAGEIEGKQVAEMLNVTPSALCQARAKWKRQQPPPELLKLTEQRQKYCIAKASGADNKTAARAAYPTAKESSLSVISSQLSVDPDCQTAISTLLARHGLTKDYRTSRLATCISSPDLNLVLKALSESWKLDGSYSPVQIDVVSAEDIRMLIASIQIQDRPPDIS